jgi:cytochrome c biogenesis protein
MYKILFTSFTGLRKFLNILGNLQVAILLLLTLALLSSIGSIIEQDKPISFYEINYPIMKPVFGFLNSDLILFLGLNRVYSTSWFVCIVILFGLSLLSCTFSRQIPSLKLAKLWKFFKSESKTAKFTIGFNLKDSSLNRLSYLLRKDNYNIIQQGEYLYAYKGLVGKIGPILVHISIIFILFGAIYGALSGFMIQEIVPKKELFHLQNVISSGPLSYVEPSFQGYIDDFKIAYSDEGLVDQFYSDVSILDVDLKPKFRKTIFVNEPLKYNNLTIYQTDWNIAGVECLINEKIKLKLPLKDIQLQSKSRFWIASVPLNNKILLVIQDLTGNYLLYNSDKKLIGKGQIGHSFQVDGQNFRILKLIPSTGLQIKADPGIPIVYVGFLFLVISVIFSYTSYSQIWALKSNNDLYIYGLTNRGVYFFEKGMTNIINKSRE